MNCGHYPMVFIPGVSTIKADPQSPEENAETYAESQQQRALERKLREEKRELEIMKAQGAPDEEIRAQRAKVRRASSDIDAFCDETGRTRRRANEYTPVNASWDGADIDAARMSGYSLTYGGKSGIISSSMIDIQLFAEKDIVHQSESQLRKGIKNLQDEIIHHGNKIAHPEQYIPDWDTYPERKKQGIITHWRKEQSNFKDSIQNRIDELKRRGLESD